MVLRNTILRNNYVFYVSKIPTHIDVVFWRGKQLHQFTRIAMAKYKTRPVSFSSDTKNSREKKNAEKPKRKKKSRHFFRYGIYTSTKRLQNCPRDWRGHQSNWSPPWNLTSIITLYGIEGFQGGALNWAETRTPLGQSWHNQFPAADKILQRSPRRNFCHRPSLLLP